MQSIHRVVPRGRDIRFKFSEIHPNPTFILSLYRRDFKYFVLESSRISTCFPNGEWLNTQSSFLYGDINQDGIIDVIDVVVSIQIIMGEYDPSSLEELLGDLNEDGTINVQDIILLVNIILSI